MKSGNSSSFFRNKGVFVLVLLVLIIAAIFVFIYSIKKDILLSPYGVNDKSEVYTVKLTPEIMHQGGMTMNQFDVPVSGRVMLDLSMLAEDDRNLLSTSLKEQNVKVSSEGEDMSFMMLEDVSGRITVTNDKISVVPRYESYIVEFKSPPLAEKKQELEQEQIARMPEYREGMPLNVKQMIDKEIASYEQTLGSEQDLAVDDIKKKISVAMTGRAIAAITGRQVQESEIEVEQTFSNVFNGVEVSGLLPGDVIRLKQSEYVKNIYLNKKVSVSLSDSVPLIGADKAWEVGYLGDGVTVGVIDTGVDYTHPDFGGCTTDSFLSGNCEKVAGGYDFINKDSDPIDDMGHGTHVAATIAGDSGLASEPNRHYFNFVVDGSVIWLESNVTDGMARVGLLYGNGTDFTGAGKNEYTSLVASTGRSIVLNESKDEWFAVSWESEGVFESYVFSLGGIDPDSSRNTTTLNNVADGTSISFDVGETVDLGEVSLTLDSADEASGIVTISSSSAVGGCRFDRIYDIGGNVLELPLKEELPAEEFIIDIYYSYDAKISETHDFSLNSDGDIDEDVTSFGYGSVKPVGMRGVAPHAKIYSYKVLDASGSGTMAGVIAGIEMAVDPNGDKDFSDHLDIISLSLGGGGDPDDPPSMAIDRAVDLGVVAVVAAGNDGPSDGTIGSPGTARNALTVAASDKSDKLASFSSRGPVVWKNGTLMKPDITAPGVDICAAEYDSAWSDARCYDDKHVAISGTSMATPHVAGVVALMKQKYPSLTPGEIKSILMSTAVDLGYKQNEQGAGRVDVMAALDSSIVISGDLDFGNIPNTETSKSKTILIKNILDEQISISMAAGQASESIDGTSVDVLSFEPQTLVLAPGEQMEITVTLTKPLTVDGQFFGRVSIDDGAKKYYIPYSFSILSTLTLEVEGEHYPSFFMHDGQMKNVYFYGQGEDIIDNKVSVLVKSGTYTVYARNDFVNPLYPKDYPETDEYLLTDMVDVPIGGNVEKIFRLSDARKFVMKAETFEGEKLNLLEWHTGFFVYKNKATGCNKYHYTSNEQCVNNPEGLLCRWSGEYCIDVTLNSNMYGDGLGDRVIYLSDKPDNGFNTDIVLKYLGTQAE